MKSNKKRKILRFYTVSHIDAPEDVGVSSVVPYIPWPNKAS
jgi:hypothetical protein